MPELKDSRRRDRRQVTAESEAEVTRSLGRDGAVVVDHDVERLRAVLARLLVQPHRVVVHVPDEVEVVVALELERAWRDHPLGGALDQLVADERARDRLCFGADAERRVVPVPTWAPTA